mmetsp:Transcript_24165/g.50686  ORF Transcript_24165/g.50686 Transcript_24165/m.50686 type:complete len:469 (+) Transcript_24165:566-1972(+)
MRHVQHGMPPPVGNIHRLPRKLREFITFKVGIIPQPPTGGGTTFHPRQNGGKVMNGLVVLPRQREPPSLDDALGNVRREQDPAFDPHDEGVPRRRPQRIDVDGRPASFRPHQKPSVGGPSFLSDQPEEIFVEVIRDGVIFQEAFGVFVLVEGGVEDVEGGVVDVGREVLEEVFEFDAEGAAVVVFAAFEGAVAEVGGGGEGGEGPVFEGRPRSVFGDRRDAAGGRGAAIGRNVGQGAVVRSNARTAVAGKFRVFLFLLLAVVHRPSVVAVAIAVGRPDGLPPLPLRPAPVGNIANHARDAPGLVFIVEFLRRGHPGVQYGGEFHSSAVTARCEGVAIIAVTMVTTTATTTQPLSLLPPPRLPLQGDLPRILQRQTRFHRLSPDDAEGRIRMGGRMKQRRGVGGEGGVKAVPGPVFEGGAVEFLGAVGSFFPAHAAVVSEGEGVFGGCYTIVATIPKKCEWCLFLPDDY